MRSKGVIVLQRYPFFFYLIKLFANQNRNKKKRDFGIPFFIFWAGPKHLKKFTEN